MKITKTLMALSLSVACLLNCVCSRPTTVSATEATMESVQEWFAESADEVTVEKTVLEDGREGVKITPKQECVDIYWSHSAFDEVELGDTLHVEFQLKVLSDSDGYDPFYLNTWGGLLVDYGFVRNEWNRVNFDGKILTKNGKNVVCLQFQDATNKEIYITSPQISDDTFTTEGIFGGVELYQYEPNSPHQTMMNGYLLITPDGKLIVQDGGYIGDGAELLKLIHQYNKKVDGWFLSHYHVDHVTALTEILNDGDIVIENLYYNFSAEWPNLDQDGHCIGELETAIANNPDKVKNVVTTKKGDEYHFGEYLTVKALNDPDYTTTINTGNNTTVVYKVETPKEDILFLGDLGESGDKYLQDPYFVREMRSCGVVQMAHHGQNGVSDKFYQVMDEIKVCLYPAPLWLYDVIEGAHNGVGVNPLGSGAWQTLHTRALMRSLGVRVNYPATQRVHLK